MTGRVAPIGAAAIAIACALLVSAGCGGSNDEQQIRDVYQAYLSAARGDDGAKLCGLLTPQSRRRAPAQTAHFFEATGSTRRHLKYSSCAEAMHALVPLFRALHPRLGRVTVNGNRATGQLLGQTSLEGERPSKPPEAHFEKVSGEWKLGSV
jgi:hypothetical protein